MASTDAPTPDSTPALSGAHSPQAAATMVAPPREQEGAQIGRYKLLQPIGEGGFGTVWMAEQREPVQRKVALKIIKLGMDTRQVIARFEAERQALALMEHPHIARVLDAGATETGRPYFVMELCRGDPIVEYCDKNSLGIEERLALFAQVCAAVQHAHTKGVIHRDIKPSNILVSSLEGRVPSPKVIDFGIAKATTTALTDKTLYTEHRSLIGTPEYMSPEQAEGSPDIDTRTDVFSLGVVLYELLTGTTPLERHALRAADFTELPRIIREVEPPRPSTRLSAITRPSSKVHNPVVPVAGTATPPGLVIRHGRAFRHELDWIVMKAMDKDRARRYDSASEFAADIQRYLKDEPVVAAPPSAAYRVKKFVVRHKVGVTAAALVVLALALGVAATTVSLFRAVRAERRAVAEAQTSGEALRFLAGLFEVVDPSEARGNTVTAREILDKGATRIETELAGQPEARATLMATMGTVYRSLGLYGQAEPLLQRALAARRDLARGPDPKLARTITDYAALLVKKGDFAGAEPLYTEALKLYRASVGEEHEWVAQTLNDQAYLLAQKGEFTEAESLYRQALDMQRRVVGEGTKPVAHTLHNLGLNLFDQGKATEAVPLLRDALATRRKLFGAVHPDVSESLNSLALVLYNLSRLDEAIPLFQEALGIQKKLVGDTHPDVAMAMNNLAFVLHDGGDLAAAEATYREVLTIQRRLLGEDHPDIARVLTNLAAVLHDKGDGAGAEQAARDALAMYRRIHGEEHPDVAGGLNNLARWVQERGDLAQAESLFRESLAMRRKLLGDQHPSVAVSRTGLANVLVEARRFDEGLTAATEARDACVKAFPEGHWRTAVAHGVIGAALSGLGRFSEAEPLLLGSYDALAKEKGAAIYRDDARRRLVVLYEAWNKPESAARFRPAAGG